MPTSEELLAAYAVRGDAAAFHQLAREHARMVFATCRRIIGNTAEAEDVSQECFLELARNAATFRGSVGAWLHGVATRKALRVARDNRHRVYHERRAGTSADADESSWAEMAPVVDESIEALPPNLREPLVLHYLQEKTQQEIAVLLGVSQPTVSRRIEEAVEVLRMRLAKKGVAMAAGALVVMLSSNAAQAVPATLVTGLGNMAVAGVGKAAATSSGIIGGVSMAKVIGITAIIAGAIVTGGVVVHRMSSEPAPQAGKVAQRPVLLWLL